MRLPLEASPSSHGSQISSKLSFFTCPSSRQIVTRTAPEPLGAALRLHSLAAREPAPAHGRPVECWRLMFDPTRPTDDESVERIAQEEDRPPQRSPGGVVSFPVPLAATRRDGKAEGGLSISSLAPVLPMPIDAEATRRRERSRSFLAHPSNRARVRAVRSWRGEQASVPEAGHRAQSGGTAAMPDWLEREVMNEVDARRKNEWIEETNDSYGTSTGADDYACECSDADCV